VRLLIRGGKGLREWNLWRQRRWEKFMGTDCPVGLGVKPGATGCRVLREGGMEGAWSGFLRLHTISSKKEKDKRRVIIDISVFHQITRPRTQVDPHDVQ